jgi:hypothetical protein
VVRRRACTRGLSPAGADPLLQPQGGVRRRPVRMFNPALPMFVRETKVADPPDMRPEIDACDRFLAAVFLRRYVTWCVRTRRQDRAEAAAALWPRFAR